jgi:hypothetical protein
MCMLHLTTPRHHIHTRSGNKQTYLLIPKLILSIEIIEFTFIHNRYTTQANQAQKDKYNPLINRIRAEAWIVNPFKVITTVQVSKEPSTQNNLEELLNKRR